MNIIWNRERIGPFNGKGCFNITNETLKGMLAVCITYVIILVHFKEIATLIHMCFSSNSSLEIYDFHLIYASVKINLKIYFFLIFCVFQKTDKKYSLQSDLRDPKDIARLYLQENIANYFDGSPFIVVNLIAYLSKSVTIITCMVSTAVMFCS